MSERDYATTGRYDPAAPRKTIRRGRERGCWLYIPAAMLRQSGIPLDAPVPSYRLWCGERGRLVVTLCPQEGDRAA